MEEEKVYFNLNQNKALLPASIRGEHYANFIGVENNCQPAEMTSEDLFQASGKTLDATADLLQELLPNVRAKLDVNTNADNGWIEKLANYWNELGIDSTTISSSLQVSNFFCKINFR